MKILNFEIRKVHSFWDLFRKEQETEYVPVETEEKEPWTLKVDPNKTMHQQYHSHLRYAFRDVALQVKNDPGNACEYMLGIVAFCDAFRRKMILKKVDIHVVMKYDAAVERYLEQTLGVIKHDSLIIYEIIIRCMNDIE